MRRNSFCFISVLTRWPTFQNHPFCNVKYAIQLVHHIAIICIILVAILANIFFPQSVRMWNELPASSRGPAPHGPRDYYLPPFRVVTLALLLNVVYTINSLRIANVYKIMDKPSCPDYIKNTRIADISYFRTTDRGNCTD